MLHKFSLAVTTANATLTGMQCVTAGTYISADITNLRVRYSADATLDGADATLSTYTTPGIAGTKTFPSFTSQVINSGTTGYIFITADIAAGATAGNTINVNIVTTAHLTFSSGTKSGSTTAGGAQTFVAVPPANNDCPGTTLTVGAAAIGGTVAGATQTLAASCGGTANDVWYQFTTTIAGNYIITVVGSASFDAVIDLRSGACNGSNVACADATLAGGTEVINSYSCAATTTYLIRVHDYYAAPATKTFTIKVEAPGSCTAPTTQASSFSSNNITTTSMNIAFTRGNGTGGVMVVARAGSAPSPDPVSGTTYFSSSTYGFGDACGGGYVVYNGTANGVSVATGNLSVSGLTAATTYYFAVYEYNSSGTCYNLTELTGNATTLCSSPSSQASSFSSNTITATSMNIAFTRGDGDGGVMVVARSGSAPSPDPVSGSAYTASSTYGSGTACGGGFVVYKGVANGTWSATGNLPVSGLTASTTYYFAIYEYNAAGTCFNLTELTGNATTLPTPPANNDCPGTALTVGAAAIGGTVAGATQTLAASCGGTANDDVWYQFTTSNAGDYVVTVVGTASFDAVIDLRSGACNGSNIACQDGTLDGGTEILTYSCAAATTYLIRVYDYGSDVPATPTFTIKVECGPPAAPTSNAASGITCNSFNANWSTVAGATKYYLDVSTVSNFATFVTGYNNLDAGLVLTYNVNTNLNPSTTYYYRVRSFNGCASSSNSSNQNLTTSAMSTPTSNAASGITCNSFNANWTAYTGATSYRLDVSTVSNFATFVTGYNDLNVGLVTTYLVNSGLNPSTTYYYRVRAISSCGTSPGSSNQNLTTLAVATPAVNAETGVTCNSFNANWTAYTGATTYYLDVSTDWLFGSFVGIYNNLDVGLVTTYAVNSGLSPSTTYYYRVRAVSSCGTSPSSSYETVTTSAGLSAPSTNAATGITCNSFNANWSIVAGATKYYLDVSTVSSFATFVTGYNNLDVGLVLTYNVNTNLNPSTTYYYRVRSYNACGSSSNSSWISLTTSAVATPTANAATGITCNSFNANWTAYTGATSYRLDVSTVSNFATFITGYNDLNVGLVTTYLVNSGLNPSTTYYYRVRAISSCGTSPGSSNQNLTTLAVATPAVNAETGVTCNSFNANWAAYTGATTYYLDVSTDWLFGSFVGIYNNLDVGLVTTYAVNSGLSPSTTYYYRIRAASSCGTSPSSSYETVTTSAGLSAPSTNAATGITCNSFNANWSTVAGATKYYLDVSTVSSFATFVTGYNNLDVGLVLTYNVNTNLNPSTTYYYRVRSYNACGSSSNSSWISLTTSAIATPTANAATGITCNSFNANWTAYSGATTYYLDVSTVSNFATFVTGYNNLDVGLVTTYLVNSGLNPSTSYYYRIRALAACGTSPNSANRSLTTSAGLSAPTSNAESNVTCTSFSANWSTLAGATKYYLDVSTEWDFSSFVTGYNNLDVGNVLTYSVTGLNSGTDYYYQVRGYNACGQSPSSSYQWLTTLSGLSAPSIDWATNEQCTSFSANWYSVGGATKYYLDVSTVWNFASFVTGYNNLDVGNVLTYIVTGLTASTTYYYRVRAWNASCNSSPSSSYETAYTTSAPSAPTANAATTICLGFIADWNSVFGATKYYLDVSTVSNFASFVSGYNNLDVGNVTSYSCTAGINPSTTYYYRLRSYNGCTSANSNTITATSGSGGAGPANNECAGATNLTVGASCNYTTYTNDCATGSAVAAPSCGGTPANDVWFSATVPTSGNVNITTLPLVMTDGAMAVYTGNCAGLTEIDCNEDYCGIAGGLMPEIRIRNAGLAGQTIRIRVWSESGATGTFKLCIFEPVAPIPCDGNPVATDNCSGATPICEANSYCGSTSDYYSVDMPGNMCQTCGLFDGSIENNSWLSFQANAATASLHVVVTNCSNGIQMGIYSATGCNGFTLMSDIDYTSIWGGQFNFNISNLVPLTPGTTYYIMIDGYAGDVCDYDITPVSGISVVDAGPDQCGTGAIQLNATGGTVYTWTPSGSLSNPNIANPVANPGVTTTYTVTTNGANPMCPATQDQVTVYEYNVSIDVSGTTDVTCYGVNDGQSIALVTGGSGFTYSWNTVPVQTTQTAVGLPPGNYTVTVTNANGCSITANVTVDPKPQMNVTYNSTQCDCFDDDGTASVASILNGVGSFPSDYTITWNTVPPQTGVTATGLSPGASYVVTVVDNDNGGCTAVVNGNPITITSTTETGNTYKWYGKVSTGWDNGNNWCRNLTTEFPKLNNHDAIIQVVPNDCIIPNDGVSYQCNNITINGVLIESGSNSKLKVSGNWINNGTFTENSGLITFNGASTYSIGGTNPTTFGNLEIAEGSGTVNMVHDVTINKNLTLTSGTLDATAGNSNIFIKGNWTNNGGIFNARQASVTFNGSATQTVKSNSNSFANVEILNTVIPSATDGIMLTDDMPINATLTLTDGTIITGANKVIISDFENTRVTFSGSNSNYTESWIYGNIRRYIKNAVNGNYVFPVGKDIKSYIAVLTNNSLPSSTPFYIDCFFKPIPTTPNLNFPSTLTECGATYVNVMTEGVWSLTENGSIDGTYDLKLYFNDFSLVPVTDDNRFNIISRPADLNDGTNWMLSSGICDPTLVSSGYASRITMNTFSEKGIAKANGILPVELLSFNTTCQADKIFVNWATASETNNDYFTLEKSSDGNDFLPIYTISGAGNSNSLLNYSYTDDSPFSITYYKLKQTDFDGLYTYSDMISETCDEENSGLDIINIFGNDSGSSSFSITYLSSQGEVSFVIYDLVGQEIYSIKKISDAGKNTAIIDTRNISEGIYIILLKNNTNFVSRKVVVRK
ncbi:MAG: T9SS type A sorting domain-containing protein [Bacteroidota bacterium]